MNLNHSKQSVDKNMFYPNSAPRENRIKFLVTAQRMKILTFYALPCVSRHSHLSFPCFRISQVVFVPVIKSEGRYTQSWLKPFLIWKIIWDVNAIDQTWMLILIFCELAVTGLNGDADLSLLHAQDSAVPCLFGLIFSSVPLMKSPGSMVCHGTWQASHGSVHLNPENLLRMDILPPLWVIFLITTWMKKPTHSPKKP